MAPKRKAPKAEEQPAAKESKKHEEATPAATAAAEVKATEPALEKKPVEPPAEQEVDASADKRPTIKEPPTFRTQDTTLNVMPMMGGRLLRPLTEGGLQYFVAGARASVGVKSGRYAFEVKIFEFMPVSEQAWSGRGAPKPKHLVRVGFSTAGSSLVLGDPASNDAQVYFDNDGQFAAGGKRSNVSKRFAKDQTVAIVLNLDATSPNADTVSLFVDGARVSQPQALPEALKGKVLYPHVSFRNMSVQVNLGAQLTKQLPFKCRGVGDAAQADVAATKGGEPQGGKYEVLVPVGYPDEGTFDWLDGFLKQNPQYLELSDRKIVDWGVSSGLWKSNHRSGKASLDKPEAGFGLQSVDDFSIRGVLNSVAPVIPRNYVVMEVRNNLLDVERKNILRRFCAPHFKRTSVVVMGEPDKKFKETQHGKLLQKKQNQSDKEWKTKQAEKKRLKQQAEAKKRAEEMKKKIEAERKKKEAERKKKQDEAEKNKKEEAEKKDGEGKEEGKEDEKKGEKKEDEPKEAQEDAKKEEEEKMEVDEGAKEAEEEKKGEAMEEEEEIEPPKVELTDEDKKTWFAPRQIRDCNNGAIFSSFANFSIPQKAEGFDEVRFEWYEEAKASEYLHAKVVEMKRTSRVENLEPSKWFQDRHAEWTKLFAEWQKKQEDFKASPAQKAKAAKKEEAKKKGEDEEEEDGAGDIFSIADVCDVEGEPLFKNFELADWALLQLRYELWMLQTAFKRDVNDPDRPRVPTNHFTFYYQKYFKKHLTPKSFGAENLDELSKMVKDTAIFTDDHLATPLSIDADADLSHFVKQTEEARRERQRRIDAGDETARLKVVAAALNAPPVKPAETRKPAGGGGRFGGRFGGKPAEGAAAGAAPGAAPGAAKTVTPPPRPGGVTVPRPDGARTVPAPRPGLVRPAKLAGVRPPTATRPPAPPPAAAGSAKGGAKGARPWAAQAGGWGSGGAWKGGSSKGGRW